MYIHIQVWSYMFRFDLKYFFIKHRKMNDNVASSHTWQLRLNIFCFQNYHQRRQYIWFCYMYKHKMFHFLMLHVRTNTHQHTFISITNKSWLVKINISRKRKKRTWSHQSHLRNQLEIFMHVIILPVNNGLAT